MSLKVFCPTLLCSRVGQGEGAESRKGSWQLPPPPPPWTTMEVGDVYCCPLGCAVALLQLVVGTERAQCEGARLQLKVHCLGLKVSSVWWDDLFVCFSSGGI